MSNRILPPPGVVDALAQVSKKGRDVTKQVLRAKRLKMPVHPYLAEFNGWTEAVELCTQKWPGIAPAALKLVERVRILDVKKICDESIHPVSAAGKYMTIAPGTENLTATTRIVLCLGMAVSAFRASMKILNGAALYPEVPAWFAYGYHPFLGIESHEAIFDEKLGKYS
jgi:hypothetical protein